MKKDYIIIDQATRVPVKKMSLKPKDIKLIKRGKSIREKLSITGILIIILISAIILHASYISNINSKHEAELNVIQYELLVAQRMQTEDNIYPIIGEYASIGATRIPDRRVVYEFIKSCGAWYPDVIMAQAIVESNVGKSSLGRTANNLFGMKKVGLENPSRKHRATTQLPHTNQNGYGKYLNWQMSVIDRILWDLDNFPKAKPSCESYINYLNKVYAEDPDYKTKIISTSQQIRKQYDK